MSTRAAGRSALRTIGHSAGARATAAKVVARLPCRPVASYSSLTPSTRPRLRTQSAATSWLTQGELKFMPDLSVPRAETTLCHSFSLRPRRRQPVEPCSFKLKLRQTPIHSSSSLARPSRRRERTSSSTQSRPLPRHSRTSCSMFPALRRSFSAQTSSVSTRAKMSHGPT